MAHPVRPGHRRRPARRARPRPATLRGGLEARVRAKPTVLSNLGLSLALSKHLPEAERALREAAASNRSDTRVRQNLVLVLGLQGRFTEAEELARQDQGPTEAAATIAYLKRSVSQPNSWDMLKGSGKPKPKATARTVEAPIPQG